jgi:hypothetical protein
MLRHFSYQIARPATALSNGVEIRPETKVVVIHQPEGNVRPKKIHQLWPMIRTPIICHQSTTYNIEESLKQRQCRVNKYDFQAQPFAEFTAWTKRYFIPLFLPTLSKVMSFKEWIDTRYHFSKTKREEYINKSRWAYVEPLSILKDRLYKKKKCFTKFELMFKTINAPARTINARETEVQCILGPIMCSITKAIKHGWGQKGYATMIGKDAVQDVIVYTSGMDRSQMGEVVNYLLRYHKYTFIGSDFKKYDSTQRSPVNLLEMEYYRHMLPRRYHCLTDEHVRYGAGTWKTVGRSYLDRGKVTAEVVGTRASGDPQTTVCNTILTANLLLYAYTKFYGEQLIEDGFKILVCGDDSLVFLPTQYKFTEKVFSSLEAFGFELTSEHFDNICQVEYCSSFFYRAEVNGKDTYYMMPKLGNILSKSALTTKNYEMYLGKMWQFAAKKVEGIYNEMYMFPEFAEFYGGLYNQFTQFASNKGMDEVKLRYIKPSNAVRATTKTVEDLSIRYDVSESEFREFLRRVSMSTQHSPDFTCEVARSIALKDLPVYSEREWQEFEEFSQWGYTSSVNSRLY